MLRNIERDIIICKCCHAVINRLIHFFLDEVNKKTSDIITKAINMHENAFELCKEGLELLDIFTFDDSK